GLAAFFATGAFTGLLAFLGAAVLAGFAAFFAGDFAFAIATPRTGRQPQAASAGKTCLEPFDNRFLGKIAANKDDLAPRPFILAPRPANVGAHQHMDALENHSPRGAVHEEHAFIPKHVLPVNLSEGGHVVLELRRIERLVREKDEGLDRIIVMVMRMPMVV